MDVRGARSFAQCVSLVEIIHRPEEALTPVLRPENNLALFIGHLTKLTPTHSLISTAALSYLPWTTAAQSGILMLSIS